VEGLVRPELYLGPDLIEFLTTTGDLQTVPYTDLKAVCFAFEPGRPDLFAANTQFERRPKAAGLWVRFTLRDGDQLDGLLAHNLIDWPSCGYNLTPPRAGASRQRVFLPKAAILTTELLGLIGVSRASQGKRLQGSTKLVAQLKMFDQ
jgi:hypothetical protein